MAGAGLGLRLFDNKYGTDYHGQSFAPWWQYAREHYLDLIGDSAPDRTTFFYDPILDLHHRLPVGSQFLGCWYSSPQRQADTRRLFDAACHSAALTDVPTNKPLQPRSAAVALALSREWGIGELEAALVQAVEAQFEPTWDHQLGEFTWGLGLGEEHPRGQFNAFLAAAEAVSVGAWTRLSAAPLVECPQVMGLDFPNVALDRAYWSEGALHLSLAVHRPEPTATTSFRIVGTKPGQAWKIISKAPSSVQAVEAEQLVTTTLESADIEIVPKD